MRITMDDLEYDDDQRVLYHGAPYTGTAWEIYADGGVMTEQNYFEGIPHGASRAYYHGGQIESERWHEYGRRNGPWRTWHANGQLREELIYERGTIVSRGEWAEDGSPVDWDR
jgi:antitoxin component YwqK of YwqJK toxin-antitoxin module